MEDEEEAGVLEKFDALQEDDEQEVLAEVQN